MTAAERIAACYAAIGKRFDPMRRLWDSMKPGERRVLLLAARLHSELHDKAWDDLKPDTQARISGAFERVAKWAGQVGAAA